MKNIKFMSGRGQYHVTWTIRMEHACACMMKCACIKKNRQGTAEDMHDDDYLVVGILTDCVLGKCRQNIFVGGLFWCL